MKKILLAIVCILSLGLLLVACSNKEPEVDYSIQGNATMNVGETQDLILASNQTIDINLISWTSSDDSVITFNSDTAVALKAGTATITATYKGNTATLLITVVAADKTITYHLNGGVCADLDTTLKPNETITLPTPTKEGSTFLGWYDNNEGSGNPVSVVSYDNIIDNLYAIWLDATQYTITYHIDDNGQERTETAKTTFSEAYTLMDVTYDSSANVFTGWHYDTNYTKAITSLPEGYNQDIDVYGAIISSSSTIQITYSRNGGVLTKGKVIERVNPGYTDLAISEKADHTFVGWCYDMALTVPATVIYKTCVLYAQYNEAVPVESITISAPKTEVKKTETLQFSYTLNPANPTETGITFVSSNSDVATIDQTGLMTPTGVGKVTITVKSKSQTKASASMEVEVYEDNFWEVSYEDESYCLVGGTVTLNAKAHLRGYSNPELAWKSDDESIAVVTTDGIVNGMKEGFTYVTVYTVDKPDFSYKFGVTVYSDTTSDVIKRIITANNSNIYTSYNLGIGAGTPVYYMDILGSISQLFFNHEYVIDRQYEATQAAISFNHAGTMPSVEFITVHYTGNMAASATAKANAQYFASGGNGTSIHYVTGNDGIYSCLDDTLAGFHAGDGHTEDTQEEWYPTGIMYQEGDPLYPTWGISKNSKYTLNGQETIIDVPEGSTEATKKVTSSRWINKMGFAYKIVNGEYYMGRTWWCYTQQTEGRLCNHGGNFNSIGIESAVNQGSDLWYTWHNTAQLVAHLMIQQNLPIERVVGHHFFTAKNCPQPMLENELEIWWIFKDMIQAEYDMLTTFKDYTYTMELLDSYDNISENGRVLSENATYTTVTYKVTVTDKNGKSESVILSSLVPGTLGR